MIDLNTLPLLPQRQDSTKNQIRDLISVADRLGLYDASDIVRQLAQAQSEAKHGCPCDLDDGQDPDDDCWLDTSPANCVYAKALFKEGIRSKEFCKYWKPVKPQPVAGTKIAFEIRHPGELNAGIQSYTDTIVVTVASGDAGGNPGEFEEHIKGCLKDWFDGAKVETL